MSSELDHSSNCPVCKAGISKENVIPLYGRGRSAQFDPRKRTNNSNNVNNTSSSIPDRPSGHRPESTSTSSSSSQRNQGNGNHQHYYHQYNPFGFAFPQFRYTNSYPQSSAANNHSTGQSAHSSSSASSANSGSGSGSVNFSFSAGFGFLPGLLGLQFEPYNPDHNHGNNGNDQQSLFDSGDARLSNFLMFLGIFLILTLLLY